MPVSDIPFGELDTDQTLEEMCADLTKAGLKVDAKKLAAILNRKFNEEYMAAMDIQLKAAKAQGQRRVMRDARGVAVGEVTQQIHPVLYQAIVRRFGREAMKDDGFIRDLLKNHPELRVKSNADKMTIIKPDYRGNSAPNRRGPVGKRGRWAA